MGKLDKFRKAFEVSPNPLLLVDEDGVIQMINGRLALLFGYNIEELIGQPVEILVPKSARKRHPQLRGVFFRSPSTRKMGVGRDLYGVTKTGKRIPVEIGLHATSVEGKHFVVASIVDITERKKQEEKFRLAVDAAASAMIMVNLEGKIVLCNSLAEEIFGYTKAEMLSKPVEMLMPSRLRAQHTTYRSDFVQHPVRRPMGLGRELFGQRKDGTEFPIEIGLTPLESHDGHFVMSTIIDVTQRRANEQEIREKNTLLSRLNDELTAFAYSTSHDLKAPVATIRGLATAILEDIHSADLDEARANVMKIQGTAEQLIQLIENILRLARGDNMTDQWSSIDLSKMVIETLGKLDSVRTKNRIVVQTSLRCNQEFKTEPVRLQAIIENLLSNSFKYVDTAKQEHRVQVLAHQQGDDLWFTVRDNGVGIPEACKHEVFQLFRRFHAGGPEGYGLGLALVKKHVDRLGGSIEFDSSEQGTEFRVKLPMQQRSADV